MGTFFRTGRRGVDKRSNANCLALATFSDIAHSVTLPLNFCNLDCDTSIEVDSNRRPPKLPVAPAIGPALPPDEPQALVDEIASFAQPILQSEVVRDLSLDE